MPVTYPTSEIHAYSGTLASVQLGGLLQTNLLSLDAATQSGSFLDNNGVLTQSDDGQTIFSLTGGGSGPIDYIGSGTISTLGLLGIEIDPRPVAVFSMNGQIYFLTPNGMPLLSGLTFSLSITPNAPFYLGAAPNGVVEGLDTAETMGLGYTDQQGDQITANADSIYGFAGNDTISADSGADTVYGGTGNDSLRGQAGNDVLHGDAGRDTILGGDNDDYLFGGADDDLLWGEAGNDLLFGDAGSDSLYGGIGDDLLWGGTENDLLAGDAGHDDLRGDSGDDTLQGGAGNDTLRGGADADSMSGGQDRDLFLEAGPGDLIDGGSDGDDHDTLDLRNWGKELTNIFRDPDNRENGYVEFLDAFGNVIGTLTFTEIETVIPCFTPGSRIVTASGEVAVEDLRVGDLVQTRDNGLQRLRWIGRREVSASELAAQPNFAPIRIARHALGPDLPERDMMVSPQHRMLMTGPRAEVFFAESEVLIAATHLTRLPGITQFTPDGVCYIHLLFDHHELIMADGVWTESFQPGDLSMAGMDHAQRDELLALMPGLHRTIGFPAARRCLKSYEAQVFLMAR